MTDLEEIAMLERRIDDAKESLSDFIKHRWPEGSPISWLSRGSIQCGDVLDSFERSIKVRNAFTGKSYWIDLYWVKEALKRTQEEVV